MKNKQKGFVIPLLITIIALIVVGGVYIYYKQSVNQPVACTMEAKLCPDGSYVGRTGPKCEFTPCPSSVVSGKQAEFNKSITMNISDKVTFPDGLSLVLKEINDSRCKPGLECFWQGELSTLFNINGSSTEEVRLGTVNNKKISFKGYTFSLESATETSATIIVSVNLANANKNGISGYIHMGPICPVERYPADPNCADKPFINAKVDITIKSNGVLASSVKSDANGNFRVNLSPETYIVKISSETNSILPRCEQKEITVTANKFASLDISCDTGIR
jgi:hypothetical protein